jgi:hypothetical protein
MLSICSDIIDLSPLFWLKERSSWAIGLLVFHRVYVKVFHFFWWCGMVCWGLYCKFNGQKKAYMKLFVNYDALNVVNKIGII